jgi:3-oxoacyl-[acyl-carrier-protein] synthase-3
MSESTPTAPQDVETHEDLTEENFQSDNAGDHDSVESADKSELETRGRMGAAMGVRVLATGSYVPDEIVTNEDLAALGCDSDWIVRRTGILRRRRAASDQATSDLCYEAALRCMDEAGVSADEIDLIIVATITPDHPTPSTACHLQRRLGAVAPAMDVNAACAGFMYAMTTAAQFLAAGNSKCALVVGADLMSRTVDPDDVKTYPLFGDAAGAVILVPDEQPPTDNAKSASAAGIVSYQLGSEGCGGEMLCIPAGGTRQELTPDAFADGQQYLTMDGRNVFKWAVRVFDESAKQVLQAADVRAEELSLVVLHQANQRIIDSAVSGLSVDAEKVFVNLNEYGNTSGASIPLALDEAVRAEKIQRGDYVLLCGFGAGLAWGTALLRW